MRINGDIYNFLTQDFLALNQVEEVKTIDGNRGVKTRVYTRITDVTTVGGDGDADNEVDEDDKMQRHDEPNIIDNIIDQALYNLCISY
jgi:hypothetical protein